MGDYSQNTPIPDAVKGYEDAGKTTPLPTPGTVGYIFYFGPNREGPDSWNHQERYEFNPEGDLVIYRDDGQEVPKQEIIKKDVSFDSIKGKWTTKTKIECVATDKYDPIKSAGDSSMIGIPSENKNHPDSGFDAFFAQQLGNTTMIGGTLAVQLSYQQWNTSPDE